MDYRIEQLRYQLREDPSSRLFFQLGEILRRDGQLDEAVGVLRRGLDVHPRYVAAWMALGRALRDRGDALGAERAFSRALELDPENQVAARLIGESAIDRAEWTRAVKALKLARALGTRDDELDERIEMVEGKLAALGLLERAEPTPSRRAVEVPSPPPPAPRTGPMSVVALSDDDPFAVSSGEDTGVWSMPEDPFTSDEPVPPPVEGDQQATMPIPRSEVDAALQARDAIEADEVLGSASETPEPATVDDAVVGDRPELARLPDIEAIALTAETITLPPRPEGSDDEPFADGPFVDEDEELEDVPADEVPLPTLTLARLALSQGDLELAERTLDGLLERVPESDEAAQLLDEVRRRRTDAVFAPSASSAAAKVVALQRWLDAIRLAAERRTL